jgi:putative transposase
MLNVEYDPDHIHMLFTSKSTLDIPKYINTIKTISPKDVRKNFLKLIQYYDKAHYSQYHIS